jgi:hypothetical protein
MTTPTERIDDALAGFYGGRPWLLALEVLQSWPMMHGPLARYGVERCFVLAARYGVGDLPDDQLVDWHCLDIGPARDLMHALHGSERALRDLPDEVLARIDAVDPDRRMHAMGVFFGNGQPVAGRPMVGARPAAWQALEDKVVIDAVFDAAGVDRSPSETVPVSLSELTAAAARLDRGQGTVWAGDAREGFHGGAARTRWVVTPDEAEAAAALLAPHHDLARVMPFLEGIPCSVHGLVFPDGVVVLRPAEMLVLRRGHHLVYARAATFWDPPDAGREQLRDVARRVGEHLRSTLDYRGAFTVDGVMTAEGFRPTELNPRVGAAMGMMVPDLPMSLLHYALIERVELGVGAAELEEELLARADAERHGSFGLNTPVRLPAGSTGLRWVDGAWQATDDDAPDATARWGAGATGGFLNVKPRPECVEVGPSFAPRVAAFAAWADEHLGAQIGPLQVAREMAG